MVQAINLLDWLIEACVLPFYDLCCGRFKNIFSERIF